jgi:hypothetical protein
LIAVLLVSGRIDCTEPCRRSACATARSCSAPATISNAEADPPLTSTTIGTDFTAAGSLATMSPRLPRR